MISKDLGPAALEKLADLLDKGRLGPPYTAERVERHIAGAMKGAAVGKAP